MIWVVMEELSWIKKENWISVLKDSSKFFTKKNKGCVSHRGLAIYMKKYLKAKDELWELKYFTMQKHNVQKSSKGKPKSFEIL
jgi:hypothetical protein